MIQNIPEEKYEKWKSTQLLTGLDDEDARNVAYVFSNIGYVNNANTFSYNIGIPDNYSYLCFPVLRRVYEYCLDSPYYEKGYITKTDIVELIQPVPIAEKIHALIPIISLIHHQSIFYRDIEAELLVMLALDCANEQINIHLMKRIHKTSNDEDVCEDIVSLLKRVSDGSKPITQAFYRSGEKHKMGIYVNKHFPI